MKEGIIAGKSSHPMFPAIIRGHGRTRVIVRRDNTHTVQSQIPLLKAIANGIQWQQYLDEGRFKSVQELAKHLGKERAVVSHTLRLAQLSPKIIVIHQINDAGMHNTSLLGKGIISGQQQTTAPFLTFILSLSSTLKCLASSPLGVEDFLNSTG